MGCRVLRIICIFIVCGLSPNFRSPQAAAEDKKAGAADIGAASPEEAFARFREAVLAENWNSAFKVLTLDSKELLTSVMLFTLYTGELGEKGKAIAYEAADREAVQKLVAEIQQTKPEHQEPIGRKLAALVKDQPGLLSKGFKLIPRDKPEDNWLIDLKFVQLSVVKIDGDTASGHMMWAHPEARKAGVEPIAFKRIKGSWYVQMMR